MTSKKFSDPMKLPAWSVLDLKRKPAEDIEILGGLLGDRPARPNRNDTEGLILQRLAAKPLK
jgi:hypothetical protein